MEVAARLVKLAEKKKKRISEMSLDEIRSIDKKIGTEVLNVIKVNNPEKEDIKKLKKENFLLKEKLNQLKSEHQKDLNSLNNIIEKLNSVLGEENV